MAQDSKNFEVLDGFPNDVLAIAAHGKLTRDDYETVLIPEFEKRVAAEGKVKMLLVFGNDFAGYSPGAAWDDAKFGFLHLREMAALAIVSDLEWLRLGVKAFAPFMHAPVAVFHNTEMDDAIAWVTAWKHEPEGKPGADVERRIPPLEDKA